MFDIGFSEMVVLAVVALVVLGPERLPKVAKQAGAWMGKLRRYVDDVKSDINRQMELTELRNLKSQLTDAAKDLESSVSTSVSDMKTSFGEIEKSFESASSTPAEPATDWDKIYAVRRSRERIKDRRIEREKELGIKRPKRRFHR
ncbi:MAG: Sec-independent protein translocase protein TatB [Burkholderiales bacterium]|jgi:sec-independent protein translocase protein TatB